MTDLRALLGERYDVVMQAACGCDGTRLPHCFECSDSTSDHECPDPVPCRHRGAGAVLARVLPALLNAADGQPVVRTVGDLTARHIGRRVRVEGWGETVFREVFPTQHSARCLFADGDHEFAATIDIPCEVLT